MKFPAVDL